MNTEDNLRHQLPVVAQVACDLAESRGRPVSVEPEASHPELTARIGGEGPFEPDLLLALWRAGFVLSPACSGFRNPHDEAFRTFFSWTYGANRFQLAKAHFECHGGAGQPVERLVVAPSPEAEDSKVTILRLPLRFPFPNETRLIFCVPEMQFDAPARSPSRITLPAYRADLGPLERHTLANGTALVVVRNSPVPWGG